MEAEGELRQSLSQGRGTLAESLHRRHRSGYSIKTGLIRSIGISRQFANLDFANHKIVIDG